jgi:NAD(P)-dependent dehydrogenase (short-subunit alcohol dehydrogenase family)
MRDVEGKVAFITGGSSGIGRGIALAFARAGMRVVATGRRPEHLEESAALFATEGLDVVTMQLDVTDGEAVERAAAETQDRFGRVHVLVNNAGIGIIGPVAQAKQADWDWIIDVNIKGVAHGLQAFLPRIRAHGEGGHIVNTASMAGINGGLGFSPYAATKFAVVAMSEGLSIQLKPHGIGVSVLCPSFVRTRIGESGRNRQPRYGETQPLDPASPSGQMVAELARRIEAGLEPSDVAARVLTAIREDELYVFTHRNMREEVDQRFAAIQAAMDKVTAL